MQKLKTMTAFYETQWDHATKIQNIELAHHHISPGSEAPAALILQQVLEEPCIHDRGACQSKPLKSRVQGLVKEWSKHDGNFQ